MSRQVVACMCSECYIISELGLSVKAQVCNRVEVVFVVEEKKKKAALSLPPPSSGDVQLSNVQMAVCTMKIQ